MPDSLEHSISIGSLDRFDARQSIPTIFKGTGKARRADSDLVRTRDAWISPVFDTVKISAYTIEQIGRPRAVFMALVVRKKGSDGELVPPWILEKNMNM